MVFFSNIVRNNKFFILSDPISFLSELIGKSIDKTIPIIKYGLIILALIKIVEGSHMLLINTENINNNQFLIHSIGTIFVVLVLGCVIGIVCTYFYKLLKKILKS